MEKGEYKKSTIASVVEDIDSRKMYLPAIQRKYVWDDAQVCSLMDSIMRGYPFGTFLFWRVKKKTVNEKQYSMYEFIKKYHERDNDKNVLVGPFDVKEFNEDDTILSVLDGQQRLTSLYITLKGSIARKLPRRRIEDNSAYPEKELFFNLHSIGTNDQEKDQNICYEFKFLTEKESFSTENGAIWYRVKDILQYPTQTDVNRFLRKQDWLEDEHLCDNILLLHERLKIQELVNSFEFSADSMDNVLDIFIRVNYGGTPLSKSDLLFSTIVAQWEKGRENFDELRKKINNIGDHFNIDNDFLIRACLYIADLPVKLNVDAFGRDNINRIKQSWADIEESVINTFILLNELGFNKDNINTYNAIIPIIYYRMKYGKEAFTGETVRSEIKKYIVIVHVKPIFGSSVETVLKNIRDEQAKHLSVKFKFSYIQELSFSGGEKKLQFNTKDIEDWFDRYENDKYTYLLLTLLYPNLKYSQKIFHQDHMHPGSAFKTKKKLMELMNYSADQELSDEKYFKMKHQCNTLANLQILEERENESKNDMPLKEWLDIPANKENVKYLPVDIDYSLANFEEFLDKRKELMLEELKRILL